MLRDRDYLLTLAAIWLLFASLSSTSRPNFVITASATSQQHQHGDSRHSYFTSERPAGATEQQLQVDLLMNKIRRNLDQPRRSASANQVQAKRSKLEEDQDQRRPEANQNSFSHYAEAAGQQQAPSQTQAATAPVAEHKSGSDQREPFREAKEVRVDQLRSSSQRPQSHKGNATGTLYLLNHQSIQPLQADNRIGLEQAIDGDNMGQSEQQQQPPFTMFAPGNSNPVDQQQNIRQILSNYQRYPQARQLSDQQRQFLNQLQPRPPGSHPQPPTSPAPAFGLANNINGPQHPQQQQQQPLSPLQLLAGPFQAFLPALAGQQQQPSQLSQPSGGAERTPGDRNPQTTSPSTGSAAAPGAAGILQPQQQPFSGLLNAFNLAPGQQQAGAQRQSSGGLPSLQDFYQQLPLYQALLAARQRQEALQAAQRARQLQPQQGGGLSPFNLNALAPPPAPNNGAGGNVQPLPPAPPFAAGLPQTGGFGPAQQAHLNQWPQSNGGQNLQQPFSGSQQPQPPASNQNGPVQFDDDQPNNQPVNANQNNNPQQQQQGNHANTNDKHDNGNQQQEDNNGNNGEPGDQNQGDDGSQQQNNDQADPNGQQQGGKAAEEEDPDLKSFQNLANGGDSFTDLFPPGILSNNDISEIKTQQAEQAKKQEAEERQRQLRQQQQQQQQQPQLNNQPLNQFAGTNGQEQPNNSVDNSQNQDQADNNSEAPDEGQDDGQQQDDDGGPAQDSPTAAALTAKSSSASETTNPRAKLAKSPGVEYATASKQ